MARDATYDLVMALFGGRRRTNGLFNTVKETEVRQTRTIQTQSPSENANQIMDDEFYRVTGMERREPVIMDGLMQSELERQMGTPVGFDTDDFNNPWGF